eukprot:CAMPEP_0171995510 /NCGR_PEP_ID=MMETSP0993-20121228/279507_1 /TAXON_ID=483369 /ORGANISM="non described non described, Strain CCMP2098" /LENGTH=63 /DNA_ID=CAMNT_0012648615 /DNA_START=236 /DNA_END=427 /DNA_ORIENTATION=+
MEACPLQAASKGQEAASCRAMAASPALEARSRFATRTLLLATGALRMQYLYFHRTSISLAVNM